MRTSLTFEWNKTAPGSIDLVRKEVDLSDGSATECDLSDGSVVVHLRNGETFFYDLKGHTFDVGASGDLLIYTREEMGYRTLVDAFARGVWARVVTE